MPSSVSPFSDESESEADILKRNKLSGIHEKQVPIAYDDGYDQDEELGRKIPRRSLTNFKFKFASSGDKAPLESINHTPLLGEGTVVYSGKEDVVVHFVATEWSIEYGIIIQLQDTPQLWVKSRNCWYKLLEASDEYKGLYQPTLQKASLCTALVDILDSLSSDSESETEGDKSGDYNSVVAALLSRNKLFTEQFLLDNRDFVVKQLKSADLPENDFIGELKKKAKRPLSPKGTKNGQKSSKTASSPATKKQKSGVDASKKRKRPDSSDTSNSSSDSDSDSSSDSDSDSDSSSDSDSASGSDSEEEASKKKDKKKHEGSGDKKHTKKSKKSSKKDEGKGSKKGTTSKSKSAKQKTSKKGQKEVEKTKKEKEKEKEKAKQKREKQKEAEKQKAKEQREKQREEEKERKQIEKERIKAEAKRYPMDDMLLEKKMRKDGQKIPPFPEPVLLPFPVPPHAVGGVLLVWEFANTYRKVIGLARNSFTAEDLASGLSAAPAAENLTLVIQVHVALLSFLLAEGRDEEDEEKTRKAPEHLRLVYEQLRKVPITHSTWFEVLRQFMELLNKEDDDDEQENDITDSDDETLKKKNKTQKRRPERIDDAVAALGTMEYEALSLEHKLALLETLCYESSNTPLFRKNIAEHLETVEALRKEKRVEELKLKEKRKAIESTVKKMVAEKREKNSGDSTSAADATTKSSDAEKPSSRQVALHLKEEEERTARQANIEHRKLEVEQKRLETAKRLEGKSIKVAEAKFASAITKETRLLRTQCIGQDRHFRRYWLFAGGKGRGFCAGRLLVEHVHPYSAVVDEQNAQEGSKNVRWSYYPSKEKILELMDVLNQKGIRELALHKALTPIVSELRAYGSEIAPTPMDSTTAVAKVDYTPPSLEKLRDTIIDFKERIPEGMRDAAALEKRFAESKEDSINELARLLRELEQHLTDAMLTEEWRDTREDWRQSVKKAATTAQVAVLLSQLESSVKLIANARGCTVCRGTGDESRLLLCDTCEDEYHTYCLHPPLTSVPRGEWVCPSCKEKRPDENDDLCTVCRGRGELLCCDYCSRAYHLKCVDPPLSAIPRGKWGCTHCVESLPPPKSKGDGNRNNPRGRTVMSRLSSRPRRAATRTDYTDL